MGKTGANRVVEDDVQLSKVLIAKLLGVSVGTVYNLYYRKELKGYHISQVLEFAIRRSSQA